MPFWVTLTLTLPSMSMFLVSRAYLLYYKSLTLNVSYARPNPGGGGGGIYHVTVTFLVQYNSMHFTALLLYIIVYKMVPL